MKIALNKPVRDEKGQAMILVLILLVLGSLIIAPLLGFMSTGLIAGQVYEVKMSGLYAADAGVEDAIWKLLNGEWDVNPTSTLTVNEMDVTVEQLGAPVDPGDGTLLYTLQSTASLAGEPRAQIVAQVEVVTEGAVAEGGEGGEYKTNEETVALSLINEDTIIFTTQNKSQFMGREDGSFEGYIYPDDLWSLNMATGAGDIYFDNDAVIASPTKMNGVHYYLDGGYDTLLMTIAGTADVGIPSIPVTKSDIIRLYIDPLDPRQWQTELVATIGNVDLVGLSQQDDGTILFSFGDQSANLGGTTFYRGQVIQYGGVNYTLLFDANEIIPDNPNLVIDCLAVLPAPDGRLLLSFTVDNVTGSDGQLIGAEDIAIWDMGPDGIANTADDTINLHIGMQGQVVAGAVGSVSIVSWEIE